NVAVGYGIAVVTQILVFPLFGLSTTLAENIAMGAIFTVASIARSFTLRRCSRPKGNSDRGVTPINEVVAAGDKGCVIGQ
ncbi:MAG: hypothetical protein KUL88_05755, partial [Rhizobium sp.]|nr:hypothetical protein [Rhizobium sp.]